MTGIESIGSPLETNKLTLYHPVTDEPLVDDEGNSMWIEVYGLDSSKYKQVLHDQTNRRLQKAQRSGSRAVVTAEQQESMALDLLAKCTKNWHIILNGETPGCTEENARDLYSKYPWIRDQVDAFVHDRKAFLKN
jgi:hypothetical protein